ncbi:tripartite tricarboxylate transporter TctB family protein [Xanthobacter dioxanivorans]|uniref:Tripartite tricarboxylate transporter TctB family protein n=1 Tax=Xanthobacter dioxanivorans TaxID=2528964 RepID=A0A974SKQ2_9HYPH|nr:tripartite tricarboxylate transporter TctB family protein [Xanthobacter dioxanivorans]QRG08469.1 tripartite tricarboxylate transporter TctB family protein [Xanthobacter dioxanivorans]
MNIIRNPKDVLSGLLFIFLAGLLGLQAWDLPLGTAVRMGPGYFPLVLAALLGLLGLIVLVNGLRFDGDMPSGIAWRAVVILTFSVVFFGFAVRPLGFLPALGITVFVSALASRKFHIVTALANTAVMVVFAWAVFIKGLGLPLPLLGPWLGGY